MNPVNKAYPFFCTRSNSSVFGQLSTLHSSRRAWETLVAVDVGIYGALDELIDTYRELVPASTAREQAK